MRRAVWSDIGDEERDDVLRRPAIAAGVQIETAVAAIIDAIRRDGDGALRDLTLKYDDVELDGIRIAVDTVDQAEEGVSDEAREAILIAAAAIRKFHEMQAQPTLSVETNPGVHCSLITRPYESVGLYIPGGTAPLVSSTLMMGIPAAIAGCPRVILCTPPPVPSEILFAARLCGIHEIYQVGGAQAVAAMAYGTESIAPVDKIFGPGNAYVSEAKRSVAADVNGPAIDMIAGPTELLVLADETGHPDFIAADLLSQAEHGTDSHVVLVSTSAALITAIQMQLELQLENLDRKEIARAAIHNSIAIETSNIDEAMEVSNRYAPEHLSIQTSDPQSLLDKIKHAGSVFLGPWSPESAGDYASGTNHVLPTYGSARQSSGLSLRDFQKTMTVQQLDREGLEFIGPAIQILAGLERLTGHAEAVRIRLDSSTERPQEDREAMRKDS